MTRHAVLMFIFNTTEAQLELSKRALDSVLAQDVGPMDVFVVNNGSNQDTVDWLNSLRQPTNGSWLYIKHFDQNVSPLKVVNEFLKTIFIQHEYVLGLPNDILLPVSAFRLMLQWPRGFVSATPIEQDEPFQPIATTAKAVSENTPFCTMLTRRWAYEAIMAKDGYFFDERYAHYCSDCDLALRMAACGIRGVQLDTPVWHYRSASHRLAGEEIAKQITSQADKDRNAFKDKWGFPVSDPRYAEAARDLNFRG